MKSSSLLIGCVYRSPSSSRVNDDNLISLLNNMCDSYSKYIIVGDFNYPQINWSLLSGPNDVVPFLDALNDCSLTQMVNCPTRGHSILDLVLTNASSLFLSIDIEEPLLGSDHKSINCRIAMDLSQNVSHDTVNKQFNFSKADWESFSGILNSVDWTLMLRADDPNLIWTRFK